MPRIIICSRCDERKEHYAKGMCDPCYHVVWYQENRERLREQHGEWRYKNPDYMVQYYQAHRERKDARSRRWKKENPAQRAAEKARYRARKESLPDTLTPKEARELLGIGQGTYPGEKLSLDHFVPLAAEGNRACGTTRANMHYIPAGFNSSKCDKLPKEVLVQLPLLI